MRLRLCVFLCAAAVAFAARNEAPRVNLVRAPEAGIQPQVAVDDRGIVHMVYYSGDHLAGNLFYVRSSDWGATFSKPLPVNSKPGSAIAAGNIRGAHIALGRNGRVHVAWNGSGSSPAPMLYTRSNETGTAFEPERNLIQSAYGLDGGGSVAADGDGNVYVFWHAPKPGTKGEENRRVWVARSSNDGKTFAPEKAAFDTPTGACGCCGMNAFADKAGNVYALYRSATEMVNRDMYLLVSRDHGEHFQGADIHPWNVGICVMSSESFAQEPGGVAAAWETKGQIYFGRIDPASGKASTPIPAPAATEKRKHPALAANSQGETLLAWTEGMGWKKGGSLAWQVFDKNGRPLGDSGSAPGVPAWSLIAAFARPDGTFTIVY